MRALKTTAAAVCIGLASMGAATSAFAWPDKTVNVIVPFPAGGATDTIARAVSNHLGTQFKQTFVV
ncbi:MAG: tripartite tricarboxylate transporter substrate binding protein, partial [Comamonas sp.]